MRYVEVLYMVCNKYGFFTRGSNAQYSKFFDMVKAKAPIHDLALVVWLCSDERNFDEVKSILEMELGLVGY